MDQGVYRFGDCELDGANRRFIRGGRELILEAKVFAALVHLVSRPGELVTREQLLDGVWGHRYITPSTLNRVIALARRALLDNSDSPRYIHTVHGAGYRFVGTLHGPAPTTAEPRARFAPPQSARAPAAMRVLVGREHELLQIGTVLDEARALTLLGTGGMGKTQCALAYAHGSADRYPDGVWFFDLAPVRDADAWVAQLALALSIAATGRCLPIDDICQTLLGRRALLVLDNCDRIAGEVGRVVIEILRGTDELKVLATSQQQLNFVGERVMRLPPLALPSIRTPSDEAELRQILDAPAVSLLLDRIDEVLPDFVVNAEVAPVIVDICERLDGMPLALELAAVRFAMLTPRQVLERLDKRFRFLVSDESGRDKRHRNLRAMLDWSYGLLSSGEQRLLAWLGVFVQGWTADAAIELAAAFGVSPELSVDLLTGLANKSLVALMPGVTPPRYRMLETVREFAQEQLVLIGDERRARDAHLAQVVRMAEAAREDMVGGRMRERVRLLVREHGNIQSASAYAIGEGGNRLAALRIAGLLMLYFKAHGEVAVGWQLLEGALAGGVPDMTSRDWGRALACRGLIAVLMRKGDPESLLVQALQISRATDDHWNAAFVSASLAMWLTHVGRAAAGEPYVRSAEEIAAGEGDPILRGAAGVARGWWHLARDELAEAIRELRRIRRVGEDFHQHHFVDMYIGLGLFRRGDQAAAAAQWLEAMRIALGLGHTRGVAGSLEGCAYIAERTGRHEEACLLLGAAERIRARTGMPLFSFWFRLHSAANEALQSHLGEARLREAKIAGMHMREEDVSNQAARLLREFAGGIQAS